MNLKQLPQQFVIELTGCKKNLQAFQDLHLKELNDDMKMMKNKMDEMENKLLCSMTVNLVLGIFLLILLFLLMKPFFKIKKAEESKEFLLEKKTVAFYK